MDTATFFACRAAIFLNGIAERFSSAATSHAAGARWLIPRPSCCRHLQDHLLGHHLPTQPRPPVSPSPPTPTPPAALLCPPSPPPATSTTSDHRQRPPAATTGSDHHHQHHHQHHTSSSQLPPPSAPPAANAEYDRWKIPRLLTGRIDWRSLTSSYSETYKLSSNQ